MSISDAMMYLLSDCGVKEGRELASLSPPQICARLREEQGHRFEDESGVCDSARAAESATLDGQAIDGAQAVWRKLTDDQRANILEAVRLLHCDARDFKEDMDRGLWFS